MPDAPAPPWSQQARQRLSGNGGVAADQAMAERGRLLGEGERLLAAGSSAAAQEVFDRAALMQHAPDTEAALVRSHLQAGDYRRALAFGAHAAGAHRREWPAGSALYAWLLHVGGQAVVARRFLDDALALAPDDAALLAARSELASPWPRATGVLGGQAWRALRLAPYAHGQAVPAGAGVVGSATLVDAGRRALMPSALLPSALLPSAPLPSTLLPGTWRPAAAQLPATVPGDESAPPLLWLRNGLGQTVAARVEAIEPGLGVAVLRLATPLPAAGWLLAPQSPFGGSPGYLVEYSPDGQGEAAWPVLRQGFFARATTAPGPRALGIDAPAGPRGGPVVDAGGRLAGLAVSDGAGTDRLIPITALAGWLGALPPQPAALPVPPAETAAVYEQALRGVLQVLQLR